MSDIKLQSKKGFKINLPEPTTPPTIDKSIEWNIEKEENSTDYIQEYKGHNIATITLVYELATDDWENAEKSLKTIKKVYEYFEDGKPAIWTITDNFINTCGIKKVVCKDFKAEKISEYIIKAVLRLDEYKPKQIEKEKKTSNAQENTSQDKTKTDRKIINPCKKQGFSNAKCREYYYKYRMEKEKGLTSSTFEVWLDNKIKKEGKPISADD